MAWDPNQGQPDNPNTGYRYLDPPRRLNPGLPPGRSPGSGPGKPGEGNGPGR